MKLATLCLLVREGSVILARKKKKIGAGRLNGYGGMVEPGESVEEATVRETREEAKVEVPIESLDKRAVVNFHFDGVLKVQVHVFFARDWAGDPQETDEMGPPEEFDFDEVPYYEMLAADGHWLPLVLQGERITANAYYDADAAVCIGFDYEVAEECL